MRRKRRIILYILLSVFFLLAAVVILNQAILGRILRTQMQRKNIPGIGMALINHNAVKWSKSFGVIKKGGDVPVSSDTLFQAASVTKTVVASLALHFVEKGKIDLDRDINDYLKSWRLPDNEFTANKKVTLRLLLSHQSGLPETDLPYHDLTAPTLVQVLNGEWPARNKAAAAESIPGSGWQYSNIAFALVQLLIEDVGGQPLDHIMEDVIFRPLKMRNSTLAYPLMSESEKKREALPHDAAGKTCQPELHPTAAAQGGLITTPSDLALFLIELMKAYQGQSSLIISQAMARQMFQAETALDPQLFGGIHAYQGLGVFIIKGKKFYILSVGNNSPGASCWAAGIPELGKGAVVMTNGQQGFDLSPKMIGALMLTNFWPMPDL